MTCPRSTSSSANSRRTTFNSRANSLGSKVMCCMASADQLDGGHGVAGRAVDEERRVVVGGIGIGHAAEAGDDLFDLLFAAVDRRAAGHDVLQHVAQPRAEVAAFEGAAGVLHVAADRGHGGRVVLLHDDRQAVIQRGERHVLGQVPHAGVLRHRRLHLGRDEGSRPAGRAGRRQQPSFQGIASFRPGDQGGFLWGSGTQSRSVYLTRRSTPHIPSELGEQMCEPASRAQRSDRKMESRNMEGSVPEFLHPMFLSKNSVQLDLFINAEALDRMVRFLQAGDVYHGD